MLPELVGDPGISSAARVRLAQPILFENSYDDFELLELPALDLLEPESLEDELEDPVLEEDEEESAAAPAGLLSPDPDLLSEAAAEMSVLPSALPVESDAFAALLPDLA
jgi:hypothetical protein